MPLNDETIDQFLDALIDLMEAKIEDHQPDLDPGYIGREHQARRRARSALWELLCPVKIGR